MRIFDPKDQLGNSLLSSADTQKSSVKLEKQMAVGGGAITLTSTDISDIENWELSNARVEVDGQMISFLPDTVRNNDGSLTVDFGTYFPNAVLILKRTVFDGMKQEEEEITIEVEIQRLMEKTMAAATAPTPRPLEEIEQNLREWLAMGEKAHDTDPVKYANAERHSLGGYYISGPGEVIVDDYFLSVDILSDPDAGGIVVADGVTGIKWHADLPCLREAGSGSLPVQYITEWNGKIPNITSASQMFGGCTGLTSWTVALPNSLTNASSMFNGCTKLASWTVELPNSLTNASSMFERCTGLTSFSTSSDSLPNSITNASNMFDYCYSLREFTPSLAGLTNCENFENMFDGCILNEDSIENILNSLPDRKGKGTLIIHIDGDATIDDTTRTALGNLADSVAQDKNWQLILSWNTPRTV